MSASRMHAALEAAPAFPSATGQSVVMLCGHGRTKCGYCKSGKLSAVSYGLLSKTMLIEDYVKLMLVGWRRSGEYFYKPVNYATCCPAYTIRLCVKDFKPNKAQRQIVRRLDRYLDTGDIHEQPTPSSSTEKLDAVGTEAESLPTPLENLPSANAPHKMTIETVRAEYSEERFELYKKYQVAVHKDLPDAVTPKAFTRFLVQSPLVSSSPSADAKVYGTFHQLYRIDGRLVAVGVVDILPVGLSSVYLFYDPEERFLALGKLTALKEISYCQENGFDHYFMGFYIHSCEKMKYKKDYRPSELLCPVTLKFFPADEKCIALLDANQFSPLEPALALRRSLVPSPPLPPAPPLAPSPQNQEPQSPPRPPTDASTSSTSNPSSVPEQSAEAGGNDEAAQESRQKKSKVGEEGDNGDDSGSSEEEDTEEEADFDMKSFLAQHHLGEFAPAFQNSVKDKSQVALDLGLGVPVYVQQLNKTGQEIITDMIGDLLQSCGGEIAKRLVVSLK